MTASLNSVQLIGNVGVTPKFINNEKSVTSFTVAINNQNNTTDWFDIICFGKTAEACATFLEKGRQVYIEGRIQNRSYTDKSGNPRKTTNIVANKVLFLGKRDSGGDSDAGVFDDSAISSQIETQDDIPF